MTTTAPRSTEPTYDVVWPLGPLNVDRLRPRRLPDPSGKTIAFLWDYVFRGDQMFEVIKQELQRQYTDIRFVDYDVFGSVHGHDERDVLARLPEGLRRTGADAVIVGVGS
jgi:hypothetical protein